MATAEDLAAGSSLPLLAGLAAAIVLAVLVLRHIQTSDKVRAVAAATRSGGATGGGGGGGDARVVLDPKANAAYLVNCLRPGSTPLDVLYAIATSPDALAITRVQLAMAAELREGKRAHLRDKETMAAHKSMEDLVADGDDDDGWAEDDEDDPAAEAARKAREEKEKEAQLLAKATGKDVTDFARIKLEGLDEGVLGQQWVRANLTKMDAWPPPSLDRSIVGDKKFDLDGNMVGLLDHPGVRRNLIMTMGRLNARELNAHPELTAAGPKGMIDPTYFQSTTEFRLRVLQTLDGTLRMACSLSSYHLASTILDAMVMFKIGAMDVDSAETRQWFAHSMVQQYGAAGVPRLVLGEKFLGVPIPDPVKAAGKDAAASEAAKKEAEKNRIARHVMQTKQVTTADEKMALELQVTRPHAEGFTKQKLAMAQRQNVPPQVALQSYRETWFILVRATKLNEDGRPDGDWDGALGSPQTGFAHRQEFFRKKSGSLYDMLEPETIEAFEKERGSKERYAEENIVIGWPFVISNVAQKASRLKIHLPPPLEPGKYEFHVTIKSQDFVGAGQDFKLVVDVAQGAEKDEDRTETKKDK